MPSDTVTELLPCPFCGCEARLDQRVTQSLWNSSDAVFSHVTCDECDISGQDFCDDPDGKEAIEWWNRRAAPAVRQSDVTVSRELLEELLGRLRNAQMFDLSTKVQAALAAPAVEPVANHIADTSKLVGEPYQHTRQPLQWQHIPADDSEGGDA